MQSRPLVRGPKVSFRRRGSRDLLSQAIWSFLPVTTSLLVVRAANSLGSAVKCNATGVGPFLGEPEEDTDAALLSVVSTDRQPRHPGSCVVWGAYEQERADYAIARSRPASGRLLAGQYSSDSRSRSKTPSRTSSNANKFRWTTIPMHSESRSGVKPSASTGARRNGSNRLKRTCK